MFNAHLLINMQKRDGQQLPCFFRQPSVMVRLENLSPGISELPSEGEYRKRMNPLDSMI